MSLIPVPYMRRAHEGMCALHSRQQCMGLGLGQDHGQPARPLGTGDALHPRQPDAQDLPVQEEDGSQRLVLGGGGDVAIACQGGQEGHDVFRSQLPRMPPAVEEDVPAHPIGVGPLRAQAVVAETDALAQAVEKTRFGASGRCWICRKGCWVCHCRYRTR